LKKILIKYKKYKYLFKKIFIKEIFLKYYPKDYIIFLKLEKKFIFGFIYQLFEKKLIIFKKYININLKKKFI
jgi:hypothetical protein